MTSDDTPTNNKCICDSLDSPHACHIICRDHLIQIITQWATFLRFAWISCVLRVAPCALILRIGPISRSSCGVQSPRYTNLVLGLCANGFFVSVKWGASRVRRCRSLKFWRGEWSPYNNWTLPNFNVQLEATALYICHGLHRHSPSHCLSDYSGDYLCLLCTIQS